jgi:serine/threonine protein phosphatase 1
MRLLAIGDIHGCYRALMALVKAVKLTPEDALITLGDYVNRGPDSSSVVDWLIHRSKNGLLIPLRGNHEIMMLRARDNNEAFANWIAVGGKETLASYSPLGDQGRLADVPDSHWDFLENHLRDYYETDRHIFVHANLYPDLPLPEQPEFMLFWEQLDEWTPPHISGKTMICGHTSQRSGKPLNMGHAVCIDTAACKGGWLSCLELETNFYWQANEAGEVRSGFLDPPA